MRNSIKTLLITLFLLGFSFFMNESVFALSLLDRSEADKGMPAVAGRADSFAGAAGYETGTSMTVTSVIASVVEIFLGILGIIFLILIIYGGYLWMTARGNEEQVTKAKDTLQTAIIGLIIVVSAYAITYFVFNYLFQEAVT